nr:probable acyl-activating enzyme 16, chloroplastic [Ipomoea batatas]
MQIRKCSPVLEHMLLSGNGLLTSSEWKTVPDIWKTAAEKFGNSVALVDRYHNPPTNMSYKQILLSYVFYCTESCGLVLAFVVKLEKEIVSFAEGLRVVGLKPDEKIALFADNSCRWLVADQGSLSLSCFLLLNIDCIMTTGAINVVRGSRSSVEELLQIYNHSDRSVSSDVLPEACFY